MQQRHNQKKGFNLIEAAIVLGVVGAVIGTIWVAASNFYEASKVNRTVDGVVTIANNAQRVMSQRDADALGQSPVNFEIFIRGTPQGWKLNGNFYRHPFGGNVQLINDSHPMPSKFYIRLFDFPPSACAKIIARASQIKYSEIRDIIINSTIVTTFPISIEQAQTECNQTLNYIGIRFAYTRIN